MKKQNIKIKNKSIPIDIFLLDAISLKHFKTLYIDSKKETNALVRELCKNETDNFHPQNIERYIISDFFTNSLRKEFKKVDIYKLFSYNKSTNKG